MIVYLMLRGDGLSELHSDVAGSLILLAAVTIGGFVFGIVMDSDNDTTSVNTDNALGTWNERRRVIFVTLGLCMAGVTYIVYRNDDTVLQSNIANGLILLAGSVSSSYIFGAVWDDSMLQQKLGRKNNTPSSKDSKW